MNERAFFNGLLLMWFLLALAVFVSLFFVAAPYGRHARKGWGPTVDNAVGWVLMEAAAPVIFFMCFGLGNNFTATTLILLGLWETHYLHRAFIYPFMRRGGQAGMPLAVVSFGLAFNFVNGYLNGRWVFTFSTIYGNAWLSDPRFLGGVALFVVGFIINRRADGTLRDLRRQGDSAYRIPQREMYRWISCPNYLGEIMIWTGWAVATWSLPGLAFAVWTVANLAPRARSYHAWYRQHFPDYPSERKALVPWLW